MAREKSTDRRKRKYGDKRKAATERNRKARLVRHELKQARMVERTEGLLDKIVETRTADGSFVGKVQAILFSSNGDHPRNAEEPPVRKSGAYLEITGAKGVIRRSRNRCKVVKK